MHQPHTEQQAKVSNLRNLLSNISARPPASPESEAWRSFQHAQTYQAPPLDQSERARAIRAINRIAVQFSWGQQAVTMFLDTRGAGYIADLSEPQLQDLHERMLAYEDATMNGYGPPDSPVA